MTTIGEEMHGWARDMFDYPRSLSGPGVRQTLNYLSGIVRDLVVHDVESGTQAFDWTVPDEWTVRGAFIENEAGERIVDFADHNLHLMGYSEAVDTWLDLEDLQKHIYSLPDQPDAIPYVTSYYKRRWGFCMTDTQRKSLPAGRYHAVVDSDLGPGRLNYGEILIPGREPQEVMLSTYVCHPSMANNEMSGPVVTAALVRWLQSEPRRLNYRITFVPETIGSIYYLSKHAPHLKDVLLAGFILTCVGDDRCYSFMPSRRGDTLADRVARHALKARKINAVEYSFLQRGSDERQYCSPLIDLPFVSIMRSKYAEYPEYHTSLDDLDLITPDGLEGSYNVIKDCLEILERNYNYRAVVPCEPQLGKRGLYPDLSIVGSADNVRSMMNVLAYADGENDLIQLAEITCQSAVETAAHAERLFEHDLLQRIPPTK